MIQELLQNAAASGVTLPSDLVEENLSVAALLARLELKPTRTAVEINRNVVPKAEYERTILRDGDHVEVINFVGGG